MLSYIVARSRASSYVWGNKSMPTKLQAVASDSNLPSVCCFCRGLKKHGGQLYLNSHVESITLDSSGKATGVQLRGGGTIKARKAVVSNASVWDTVKLLPADHPAAQSAVLKFDREAQDTPECNSFMHLHVGFDKTGMCCGCLVVSQVSPAALYLHGGSGVES